MPEQYRRHHRHPGKPIRTLQDAADDDQLICVRCALCRRATNFLATDLVRVLDRLRPVDAPPFACSKCGKADYIDVKVRMARDGDYGHLVIRRLLRLRTTWEWGNRKLGESAD